MVTAVSINLGIMVAVAAASTPTCDAFSANTMWRALDAPPAQAWRTIFGEGGERGEYMDGYSADAMVQRCIEDYKWAEAFSPDAFASERADMMSHLYDNDRLWKQVCMVAFAEHYALSDDGEATTKPFDTFQRQKDAQPMERPIFGGVILSNWQAHDGDGIKKKLALFKEKGIDYIRLECNFGTVDDIGSSSQLADNPRFGQLAEATKACQDEEIVPLVLIQLPWREPGGESNDYFDQAIKSFAASLKLLWLKSARVEPKRLLLETRPPIGLSAQEERSLSGTERVSLGLKTGRNMFETIEEAFDGDTIAGFCVAGGSTKGDVPTAMEDDTQNAVRQGMRQLARRRWGYELCFWEMGAKLMLQPKVGRLWRNASGGRDAARELFYVNAQDLADEIKAGIS